MGAKVAWLIDDIPPAVPILQQCPYEPVTVGFGTRLKPRETGISGHSGQQFRKRPLQSADRSTWPVNTSTLFRPACLVMRIITIDK